MIKSGTTWAVVVLVISGVGAAARAAESPAERREALETAVPEAIRLLEAKEYATFLKSFVVPEDFRSITSSVPLDQFAQKFGQDKAGRLLAVLKASREVKPTLDSDGTKATYVLKDPIDGKARIVWVKVEGHWYIQRN